MNTQSRRIFVEKKPEFRLEADSLRREFNENLSMSLGSLRLLNVYDLFGFSDELIEECRYKVFGERVTDEVRDEFPLEGLKYLAVENIPGQFDQRASSAVDCVHLIDPHAEVQIRSARLLIFDEDIQDEDIERIKKYFINAVESRPKDMNTLKPYDTVEVKAFASLEGFISMKEDQYSGFCETWGLAMSRDDLAEVVEYFKKEGRNPTETELRILDTYWSDHCRHTTFTTELREIEVEDSFVSDSINSTLEEFKRIRKEVGTKTTYPCLMELATIGAKYLEKQGLLEDLEKSEEQNACSIYVDVDVDGKMEKWLLLFKNETHNHPTEIEPFGGASTCIGGAIRDPLSGRAYVYQAVRVSGSGDITLPVKDTLAGKLPQSVISRKAAAGYSCYGNQIGLATGLVREIYHPGYVAKRLETGAVLGAVRASAVQRKSPEPGDIVLLIGGKTGRDGIGGATGSSKGHDESSIENCGSEVQKGNAPEERKLQRLFRREEVSRLIKKANDFGAGGVSVAIGELAAGLDIHLDRVPLKYEGLNSTEIAVSESQERMAVVIRAEDREEFEAYCRSENVEYSQVAEVSDSGRMRMFNGDKLVADISREFIDSAGAVRIGSASIAKVEEKNPFERQFEGKSFGEKLLKLLDDPNVASRRGMVEMFDSTIGRSTVLIPYGGIKQSTEAQVSVQKFPVDGYTNTTSIISFGFNPFLSEWSPFHGAAYAMVEACSKVVAAGADWSGMRFCFQEYFERMSDPLSWGNPCSALLGALKMQVDLGLPSIGGKDSMSGTFGHINVPPTLIAFGITTMKANYVISPEFKRWGNSIYLIKHSPLKDYMPDTEVLKDNWDFVHSKIVTGDIISAWAVEYGGIAEAVVKMCFGNAFGAEIDLDEDELFAWNYGSIVVEATEELDFPSAIYLGKVTNDHTLKIGEESFSIEELQKANERRYSRLFPTVCEPKEEAKQVLLRMENIVSKESETPSKKLTRKPLQLKEKPLVFIPVFPGTNCDYDTAKAFRNAGAEVAFGVFCNIRPVDVFASIEEMAEKIASCDILSLAGGFSAGDEPDGSGKFIANVLENSKIAAEIAKLLERGGLILGICNGFQALVKSGLLPYGTVGSLRDDSPTLFRNDINRHVSRMVTTKVVSTSSPWLSKMQPGDLHTIAVSHGEGKFVVGESFAQDLFSSSQVAFQYVDPATGEATMESPYNPNGSAFAIEGITDLSGQILGKMGHSERYEMHLFKNIKGIKIQPLFEGAVAHFREK